MANYLASQARDPGIDSHQHLKDTWHIWRHLRNDIVFSCNLRCLLIFLHGRSRTYRVASLRAGPVGRISYNLYFDCKPVRYVTCDFNKRIYFFLKSIQNYTHFWFIIIFQFNYGSSANILHPHRAGDNYMNAILLKSVLPFKIGCFKQALKCIIVCIYRLVPCFMWLLEYVRWIVNQVSLLKLFNKTAASQTFIRSVRAHRVRGISSI